METTDSFYTQIPNDLMQILMSKQINSSMKAVLIVTARKTYGFHKKSDEISLSQFQKETKLSRPTVVEALKRLKSVRLIIQLSKGRCAWISSEWKIDLTNWEDKLVKLSALVKYSDNGLASPLVKSTLQTKEIPKDTYNYLKKSSSTKETNFGGNPEGGTKPQPKEKTPPDVVFSNLLKRISPKVDEFFESISYEYDEYGLSTNKEACFTGIRYYIRKYKVFCGEDHPPYRGNQLLDCVLGFLSGIWEAERSNLNLPLDEIIERVIDRWFATTSNDPNNLRLSHFVGRESKIFSNCLTAVMADNGMYWKEESANS